jgi:hypothetical protein
MYSNIFADELQRLIDDADVKNGPFGEKQVWVSDYKGNIEFELESQTDRMKVVYNANTDEWTVDTNDGHFEGKTFNAINATLASLATKGLVSKTKAVRGEKMLTKYVPVPTAE